MKTKEQLVLKMLDDFNKTFEKRPGMLGKTYQIEPMFFLIDQLSFIQEYREEIKPEYSWNAYLCEKKYIEQGDNKLEKQLLQAPVDYDTKI